MTAQHPYLYSKGCPSSYNDPTGGNFKGLVDNLLTAVFTQAVLLTCIGTASLAVPVTAGASGYAGLTVCPYIAGAAGIAFNSYAFD